MHHSEHEQFPDAAAADALAFDLHGFQDADLKAALLTPSDQILHLTSPGLSKPQILSDPDFTNLQPIDQIPFDELLGFEVGKGGIERLNDHGIDSQGLEKAHLVSVCQNQARRALGKQDLQRMGFESQNNGRAAPLPGLLNDAPQKRLMTQVDAVEIAHSEDGIVKRNSTILYMTVNLHDFFEIGIKPSAFSARLGSSASSYLNELVAGS